MSNKLRIRNRKLKHSIIKKKNEPKLTWNKHINTKPKNNINKKLNDQRFRKLSRIANIHNDTKSNNIFNPTNNSNISNLTSYDSNISTVNSSNTSNSYSTNISYSDYINDCWVTQLYNEGFVYGINSSIIKNTSINTNGYGFLLGQFTGPNLQVSDDIVLESDTSALFLMEVDNQGNVLNAFKIWDYNGIRENYQYGQVRFSNDGTEIVVISTFVGEIIFTDGNSISDVNGSTVLAVFDFNAEPQFIFQITADSLNDIYFTLDINDNIYVCGTFVGRIEIGEQSATSNLDANAFISRINTDGSVPWLLVPTGSGSILGEGIDYSSRDNTIISVGTFTDDFILDDEGLSVNNEIANTWISKLSLDGQVLILTAATHPQSQGSAADYIESSQVFVSSTDEIYVVGDMFGTFLFGENNEIIADNFRVFVAKMDNDLNWLWARSLQVNTPQNVSYDPKVTVLENKNIVAITNFGFGDITYYTPEDDGTEEIYSVSEGSGTLDLVVSYLDTDGNWLNTSIIAGTISNMSIDIVSIFDTIYIAGSRLVTTERTDGFINGIIID